MYTFFIRNMKFSSRVSEKTYSGFYVEQLKNTLNAGQLHLKIFMTFLTLIAPSTPPYIAPATAGVHASCPAMYKFGISVSGRITQREFSLLANSKLHLVPYEPPRKDCKKFESETGVPHSYHNTLPLTWGTYVQRRKENKLKSIFFYVKSVVCRHTSCNK